MFCLYFILCVNLADLFCKSVIYYYSIQVPKCSFVFFSSGGALKPTDIDTLWVHVTCAWFQPEVAFLDHEKMEPAMGILRLPINSFMKVLIFFPYNTIQHNNAKTLISTVWGWLHGPITSSWEIVTNKDCQTLANTSQQLAKSIAMIFYIYTYMHFVFSFLFFLPSEKLGFLKPCLVWTRNRIFGFYSNNW